MDHNKVWKILKEMGVPDNLTCLLRNLYVGQEATESDMEQWTVSELGKEYGKTIYCQLAYLTHMQNRSCEMPRLDEAQAGINIDRRNINNLRQQMISLSWQKVKRN